MDKQTIILAIYSAAILALAFLKISFFSTASRKRAVRRWFYFNNAEIINAQTQKIREARTKQNRLSLAILILLVLSPLFILLVIPFISW